LKLLFCQYVDGDEPEELRNFESGKAMSLVEEG
jgi:hypothetical protein